MKQGMLWFDDDPKRALSDKVERAANRFNEKYGMVPTLAYANPATMPESERVVHIVIIKTGNASDVQMKQANSIMPNHFWLGVPA